MRRITNLTAEMDLMAARLRAPLEGAPLDLHPRTGPDVREILEGLRARPKNISPKYFYDAEGSRLFEEICDLPEYYPTRTEIAILETHAEDIARRMGPGPVLIEYGSGSSRKTRILLDCLFEPAFYMPVEISRASLVRAVQGLSEEYPSLRIRPVCADYMNLKAFPLEDGGPSPAKRVLFFPGSTIGNLHPRDALRLLRDMRAVAGSDGALVIGVDLLKEACVLERAYNDARGVTAAFNLNLLRRLNTELGADFPLDAFRHRAFFHAEKSRIEMHLVAERDCSARLAGESIELRAGESIHTENSYKYSLEGFDALLREAGFATAARWTDPRRYFSVFYCDSTRDVG